MKNVFTILMCSLCIHAGIAQSDFIGNTIEIPDRTPALEALYQQAKNLDQNNGTAAEINANRLAIKNAWQEIDPNVAALYKPIETNKLPETVENLPINGIYVPTETFERDEPPVIPEDWGVDLMLMDDWVDGGVDVEVTDDGVIYVSAFQNDIENGGGTFDEIIIFRSVDDGVSFTEWVRVNVTAPMRKLQIISMDGSGDEYLLAYLLTDSNTFQVWRWNMATTAFDAFVIETEVIDFSVDRNYPGNTSSQRVFATYNTVSNSTYSARSTAGSYGTDWVDATSLGIVSEQIEFSYGLNGGCYTTFIGFNSRSLRANANDNFNDPASWGVNETIVQGSTTEVINPTIRAARLDFASDKVIIWGSQRPAGSSSNYDGIGFKRENGAAYTNFSNFGSGGSDWNIAHTDSWMRKENGTDIIRTSYIRDNIPDTEFDSNRSLTFNGTNFDTFEPVIDASIRAFDGFPAATAETSDNLPCMAFAGTSNSGTFGHGLYFDRKSTLGVETNSFEGFKFYPNPAQEIINISATNTIEKVSMFSLLGKQVLDTSVEQTDATLDLSSLAPGVYLMKTVIDGNSVTHKIIKQ